MTKQPANEHDARELAIYAINNGTLYTQQAKPIMRNLARKLRAAKYDHERAIDLWCYLTAEGARLYVKEYGSGAFNPATRRLAAIEVAAHYADELAETELTLA